MNDPAADPLVAAAIEAAVVAGVSRSRIDHEFEAAMREPADEFRTILLAARLDRLATVERGAMGRRAPERR